MNKFFVTLSVFAILVGSLAGNASAGLVVTLTDLDLGASFSSDVGFVGTISNSVGGSGTLTHSFEVTGLDLADDSTADDTLVVSYNVSPTGGVVAAVGATEGYGVDGLGDDVSNAIGVPETLTFDNLAGTVTFGDSTPVSSVQSVFFESYNFVNIDPSFSLPFVGQTSAFTVSGNAGLIPGFGIEDISVSFEFSAVPEPSSLMLVSIPVLGMVSRRRK